jgi:hypothetical protein
MAAHTGSCVLFYKFYSLTFVFRPISHLAVVFTYVVSTEVHLLKNGYPGQAWWLVPLIPATGKAKIGYIMV